MSLDISAVYGYGFLITEEDIETLSDELHDEFVDSDYARQVSCYNPGLYFFGIVIEDIEPGDIREIPVVDNYDSHTFIEMMQEFKRFFPHKDVLKLRHYLIHQLW